MKFCLDSLPCFPLVLSSHVHTWVIEQTVDYVVVEKESSLLIAENMDIEESSWTLAWSIYDSESAFIEIRQFLFINKFPPFIICQFFKKIFVNDNLMFWMKHVKLSLKVDGDRLNVVSLYELSFFSLAWFVFIKISLFHKISYMASLFWNSLCYAWQHAVFLAFEDEMFVKSGKGTVVHDIDVFFLKLWGKTEKIASLY